MNDELMIDVPAYKSCNEMHVAYRCSISNNDLQAPHVLFCGGFHSNMLGTKAIALEAACLELGLSYTRFDYRGHGESGGDPADFTIKDWLEDTLCILNDIDAPLILIGSSMGGWLASLCAVQKPEQLQGLLLIAAAPDFLQEIIQPRLTQSDIWDLQQGQILSLPNAYAKPHPLTQSLLESGSELSLLTPLPDSPKNQLATIACTVRLIHGTNDTEVPYDFSVRLMEQFTNAEAQLTLISGADHRLSDTRSLRCIQQILSDLVTPTTT